LPAASRNDRAATSVVPDEQPFCAASRKRRGTARDETELGLQFVRTNGKVDPWTKYAQVLLLSNEFAFTD
jgi:hypothetical protein